MFKSEQNKVSGTVWCNEKNLKTKKENETYIEEPSVSIYSKHFGSLDPVVLLHCMLTKLCNYHNPVYLLKSQFFNLYTEDKDTA